MDQYAKCVARPGFSQGTQTPNIETYLPVYPSYCCRSNIPPEVHANCWKSCGATLLSYLFSQIGVLTLFVVWSLVGAFIFHALEGLDEQQWVGTLSQQKTDVIVKLLTELRLVKPEEKYWRIIVEDYMNKYEGIVQQAASRGYTLRTDGKPRWGFVSSWVFSICTMTTVGKLYIINMKE